MKQELTEMGRAAVEAYRAWTARREEETKRKKERATYLRPTDQHNLKVIRGRAERDPSLYLPEAEKALREAGIPVTSNQETAPEKEMRRA